MCAKSDSTCTVCFVQTGVRVNIVKQEHESQRGQVRVTLPGGRQLESLLGEGTVAIGARTMQEGGAFGDYIREQVRVRFFFLFFCLGLHRRTLSRLSAPSFFIFLFVFAATRRFCCFVIYFFGVAPTDTLSFIRSILFLFIFILRPSVVFEFIIYIFLLQSCLRTPSFP